MAEIEFKRRGTPVWAVVLVLLVLAAGAYALFGRGGDEPTSASADTTVVVPPAPSTSTGAVPAAPVTPHAAFAHWIDSASVPQETSAVAAYAGSGLQLLAGALQEKVPMAGVQQMLVRAMADTVVMPTTPPRKQVDATQAAFFAVAYALRDQPAGALVEQAAQRLQLTRSLVEQRENVQHFFEVARDALRDPSKGPTPPPPAAPATKG